MGITVFYGTDKEALGIRNKLLISHTDVNTIMLVPEQFSLSAELTFSDVSKINFEVLSFRRLCKKIFESAGAVGPHIIAHNLVAVNAEGEKYRRRNNSRAVLALRAMPKHRAAVLKKNVEKFAKSSKRGLG